METKQHKVFGGVVLSGKEVLLLERHIAREGELRHEVRLPKGHADTAEDDAAAALREVCEESGYCGAEVIADLGWTRSDYVFNGKRHLRDERYYLMAARKDGGGDAAPASDEEKLFRVRWVPLAEAAELMTYPSEKEFIQRAQRLIAAQGFPPAPPA